MMTATINDFDAEGSTVVLKQDEGLRLSLVESDFG